MNNQKLSKNKVTSRAAIIEDRGRKNSRATSSPASSERAAKVARVGRTKTAAIVTDDIARRKDGRAYVQKNTLTVAMLVQAKEKAEAEGNVEEERRAANRLSSFQSRQRKKEIIKDLESVVADLTEENKAHSKTIKTHVDEIQDLKDENFRLKGMVTIRDRELASLKMEQQVLPTSANTMVGSRLQHASVVNDLLESQNRGLVELLKQLVDRGQTAHTMRRSVPAPPPGAPKSNMVGYNGPLTIAQLPTAVSTAVPGADPIRALLQAQRMISSIDAPVLQPAPHTPSDSSLSSNSSRGSVEAGNPSLESNTLAFLRSLRAGGKGQLS